MHHAATYQGDEAAAVSTVTNAMTESPPPAETLQYAQQPEGADGVPRPWLLLVPHLVAVLVIFLLLTASLSPARVVYESLLTGMAVMCWR
jgi:hypothetical protein